MRYCFIDTETGGLDPTVHGITEIAAIAFDLDPRNPFVYDTKPVEFSVLIRPNKEMAYAPAALELQDRTLEYLSEYGVPEDVAWNAITEFLFDQINWRRPQSTHGSVIAQFATFDYGFLAALAARVGEADWLPAGKRCEWLCTKNLFRTLSGLGIVAPQGCGLNEIMKWYGIEFAGKQHNALVDCRAGIQVFRHMVSDLKNYYNGGKQ